MAETRVLGRKTGTSTDKPSACLMKLLKFVFLPLVSFFLCLFFKSLSVYQSIKIPETTTEEEKETQEEAKNGEEA